MRLRHIIGLHIIDLVIITLALIGLLFSVSESGDLALFTADAWAIALIVFGAYVGTVFFVELLLIFFRQDTWAAKGVKAFVSSLMVLLLFPNILWFFLWIFGLSIAADVGLVLTATMILRCIVRVILSRRWKEVDV